MTKVPFGEGTVCAGKRSALTFSLVFACHGMPWILFTAAGRMKTVRVRSLVYLLTPLRLQIFLFRSRRISFDGSDIGGLAFNRTFWGSLRSPYILASLTGNGDSVVSSIGHPKWLTFGCSSHGGPVSRDRGEITSISR